jgi:hypothetical protein
VAACTWLIFSVLTELTSLILTFMIANLRMAELSKKAPSLIRHNSALPIAERSGAVRALALAGNRAADRAGIAGRAANP